MARLAGSLANNKYLAQKDVKEETREESRAAFVKAFNIARYKSAVDNARAHVARWLTETGDAQGASAFVVRQASTIPSVKVPDSAVQ